jgi:dCMP deaminase
MGTATLAAQRSTCFRGNVGAVMVYNDCIISLGYNGPPADADHCHGNTCATKEDGGCLRAVHAERNMLARVPKRLMPELLMKPMPTQVYCTAMPCPGCAAAIIDSAIVGDVYYQSPYRITTGVKDLLNANINVYRFSPSGYLVSEETGEVLEAN